MTTQAYEITEQDIRKLRDGAAVAGDLAQVEICDIALGTISWWHRHQEVAWAACARVIADAAAMDDES